VISYESNRFLSVLSPASRNLLLDLCTEVDLPIRTPLFDAEAIPDFAYFITSGIASVVSYMEDGGTAEVEIIGREGIVGSLFLLGPGRVSTSCFMQMGGKALRIRLPELQRAFRSKEEIRDRILEFLQERTLTISQIAACNRLHEAEERLARWLLMAEDRTQSNILSFTQEFLAQMLGARRTTVTVVAGALQRSGFIEYQRGRVKIVDRVGLEDAACECYRNIRHLHNNLYSRPLPRTDG
jgi:CRP-like cAMP-binding protein